MKITFIGTSHGVPAKDRYCSCILLEVGGSFYFVDAGAPLADVIQRRGLDFNNFKAVFTTHAHGDHTAGIFQAADLLNWYYKGGSADFFLTDPEQIKHYEGLIYLSNNSREIDSDRVRFRIAQEGVVFDDGMLRVEYIRNKHMTSSPSYSILVYADGKRVLFSGDMSNHLAARDLPEAYLYEGVDAFVCELAHFSLDDLAPYIEKARTDKLFLTHVYPDSKFEQIIGLEGKYPFEIVAPNDSDEFEI